MFLKYLQHPRAILTFLRPNPVFNCFDWTSLMISPLCTALEISLLMKNHCPGHLSAGDDFARFQNSPDKSLQKLRTAKRPPPTESRNNCRCVSTSRVWIGSGCFVLGQESRRQEQKTDRSDKTVTRKHGPFLEDLLTPARTPDPTGSPTDSAL